MGKLKKVEAGGGPVETLCDAPLGRGGTWSQDGLIIYSPNISQPLFRVAAGGGPCAPLTQLDTSRRRLHTGGRSFCRMENTIFSSSAPQDPEPVPTWEISHQTNTGK